MIQYSNDINRHYKGNIKVEQNRVNPFSFILRNVQVFRLNLRLTSYHPSDPVETRKGNITRFFLQLTFCYDIL